MYLNCKTYFSFKYGTFSTEELVQTAVYKGVTTLALTNINSTWDNWEFVKLCRQQGIKPVVGVEIRNGDELCCILLAANQQGLTWVHEFISAYPMNGKSYPVAADGITYFEKETDGFVVFPTGKKKLEELKCNERIGVRTSDLSSLFGIDTVKWGDRFVVCHPVTVQDKKRYELHRILRAIDHNVVGSKLIPSMLCSAEETFISPAALLERFKLYPSIVTFETIRHLSVLQCSTFPCLN